MPTKKSDKSDGYDPKNDLGAHLRLLNTALEKATAMVRHLDSQLGVLVSINLALFAFATSRLDGLNNIPLLLVGMFAAAAGILALMGIHPPKFMRKRGQAESLFYNKKVANFTTSDQYTQSIEAILGDQQQITKQYTLEIYNLYRYYYRPKRLLFVWSRNLLLFGIIASGAAFYLGSFVDVS